MTDGRDSIRSKYRPLARVRGASAFLQNYIDADLMNIPTFVTSGRRRQILGHAAKAAAPIDEESVVEELNSVAQCTRKPTKDVADHKMR
jgi:hypothetical protein